MPSLPPLNGLRAFDAAGRRLNFRVAADELGVTQGAVAQQVRQLETHLGVPLFDRVPKGLAFTPAGRSYHAHVSAAFQELRRATGDLWQAPGRVLVSVTPTFAAKWLIPNLPDFSARHPEIDLRVLATEKVSSFHSDGIDLAIRQGEPPFGASLIATRLFRQEVIAVASPDLVGGLNMPLSADDMSRLPKIHDAHDLWPTFLKRLNVNDGGGRGLRLSQTSLAVDAALTGQGAALVSRFLVAHDISVKNLVRISPDTLQGKQDFYLLAERRAKRSPDLDAVIAWLSSRAGSVKH